MRTTTIWKSLLMSAALLVSGAMVSCDKEEDVTDFDAQISTSLGSSSTVSVAVEANETINFTVSSNTKWTATVDDANNILSLSKTSGNAGDTAVTATISESAAEGNKATVTLSVMGYAFGYEIPVTQKLVFTVGGEAGPGSGTADDPFTVAGAIAKAKATDGTTTETYYIKGVVSEVTEQFSTEFGNGTFNMVDDGSNDVFIAYRIKYFNNQRWVAGNETLSVGDEIIVCGQITTYNGKYETSNGYLYAINGVVGGGEAPETPGDDDENVIGKIADLKAGDYYMSAYISGNYYLWSGTATTSGTSTYLSTSQYTYNAETATLSPVANNNAVKMTLEAVSGKSNTYYIMYGGKYVYTTGTSNHNLGFGDTKAEWVFTDNSSGGVVATSGGLTLGTSTQAQSNQLRALANAANVGGMYFFSADVTIDGEGGGGEAGEIKHEGTAEDPYTVADAIAKAQETGTTETTNGYYIKGKVKTVKTQFSTQYGDGTFELVDEGSDAVFTAYQIKYFNNVNWTTGDKTVSVNDELVVYGKIINYAGNTPETSKGSGYLVELNGEKGEDNTGGGNQGGGEQEGENLTAGDYYMFGVVNGKYYAWDGKDPYSGQLQTREYNYNQSTNTYTVAGEDNYAGFAGKITIAKAGDNTYYIKSGDKYLYSTEAANHKLELGTDNSNAEWTFTKHSAGGYLGHNNGINLGTNGGASSRFIRGMVNETNLTYGIDLVLASNVTIDNGEGGNQGGGNEGGGDDDGDYKLVTTAPASWAGEYIIGYANGTTLYTLNEKYSGETATRSTFTYATTENYNGSSISGTFKTVTFEAVGDKYAIKYGSMYVGWTSATGNSCEFTATAPTASNTDYLWTLSVGSDGTTQITNVGTAARRLQFNANKGQERFAIYTGTQKDVLLFAVGSGDGGNTGGGTTDPNPNPGGGETVDVLNNAFTGVGNISSYTDWSGKTGTSGAVYAGRSAGQYSSIQLRVTNSNEGVVTTTSGGKVAKMSVKWNTNTAASRTLDVYCKNTAYESAADLFNTDKQGTKVVSFNAADGNKELTIDGEYTFIGFRSNASALYLDEVTITWE